MFVCLCIGYKSTYINSNGFILSNVNQLWIEAGGRLENELLYTEKSIGEKDTFAYNQLIIQTPKNQNASILHSQALLKHLEIVKRAISVEVYVDDIRWSIKDICQSPAPPDFDQHFIEQIFENIIPCTIITPLDCFWEGAKLMGPSYPVKIP
jgi:patched 1 protein